MQNSAHVFISYSRRNKAFAERLFAELNKTKRDVWVDWDDIPRASDWMQEIYSGIDNADTFIFLVSEHSLVSEICNQELRYALQQNKRIIPVILQQIQDQVFQRVTDHWKSTTWYPIAQKNWDALKHLNWVFFDDPAKYDTEFAALIKAIDQDLFHIKTHTRLFVRAQEWVNNDRNTSSLLAGDDIISAEHWLQTYEQKEPLPTDLHREFILGSRQEENARIARTARLQNSARIRLQILVASFVVIILAMVFGLLPLTNQTLVDELGEDTDNRLEEAAVSFEAIMEDDLTLAELSANAVDALIDVNALARNESSAFDRLIDVRDEFELQEISFFPPTFDWGDEPIYYDGPEIRHSAFVTEVRTALVLDAFDTGEIVSRLIVGSPESQIASAIPIFGDNQEGDWDVLGVVLVAFHITEDYVQDKADILNVEVVLMNLDEEIVATTLAEGSQELGADFRDYNDARGTIFDAADPYRDYETVDGTVLRMIQHPLQVNGETQGYLFVARSFEAVLALEDRIAQMFLTFSGIILVSIIVLIIGLIGIPALRNRLRPL